MSIKKIIQEEVKNISSLLNEILSYAQRCNEGGELFDEGDGNQMAQITGFGNDDQSYETGCEQQYLISGDEFKKLTSYATPPRNVRWSVVDTEWFYGYNKDANIAWAYSPEEDIHYFFS